MQRHFAYTVRHGLSPSLDFSCCCSCRLTFFPHSLRLNANSEFYIMRVKAFALAMSLMAIPPAFCLPTDQVEKPGLTHEEWLEYLSLNTTDGWEPMTVSRSTRLLSLAKSSTWLIPPSINGAWPSEPAQTPSRHSKTESAPRAYSESRTSAVEYAFQ